MAQFNAQTLSNKLTTAVTKLAVLKEQSSKSVETHPTMNKEGK